MYFFFIRYITPSLLPFKTFFIQTPSQANIMTLHLFLLFNLMLFYKSCYFYNFYLTLKVLVSHTHTDAV